MQCDSIDKGLINLSKLIFCVSASKIPLHSNDLIKNLCCLNNVKQKNITYKIDRVPALKSRILSPLAQEFSSCKLQTQTKDQSMTLSFKATARERDVKLQQVKYTNIFPLYK